MGKVGLCRQNQKSIWIIMKVCVFCASSAEIDPIYMQMATRLGQLLAENSITCINGAGNQGLMGALNNAILRHGGEVIGIIPQFMVDNDWCHSSLTDLIITDTMHERKMQMTSMSDAVIALPGGFGTLEELAEIITWKQLGLYNNPVIIVNCNNYYDSLLAFFDKIVSEKFMPASHRETWQVVNNPETAIQLILNQHTEN